MLRKRGWRRVTTPDVDAQWEGLRWGCRMREGAAGREKTPMNGKYQEALGPEGKQSLVFLMPGTAYVKELRLERTCSSSLLLALCLPGSLAISH